MPEISMRRTMIIAHRGACSLAPENTLAAARQALRLGADMWELDTQLTRDGELVVVHDDRLERTSNARQALPGRRPWFVRDLTLDEIRRLDCGSWFNRQDPFKQIAAGAVSRSDQESYAGERAPTLREALMFTRDNDWRVNVEIKSLGRAPGAASVVEKVVALIEELGMTDRVLISSFNQRYLERVKAANPAIATGVLVGLPVLNPPALLRRLKAQAYHPCAMVIRPEAIAALRRCGFEVNVWTVNDEKTMRRLIEAGVSGIITDFPQTLSAWLDSDVTQLG